MKPKHEIITANADPQTREEFWSKLKASGMRECTCAVCGLVFLTRAESNLCPPCQDGLCYNCGAELPSVPLVVVLETSVSSGVRRFCSPECCLRAGMAEGERLKKPEESGGK